MIINDMQLLDATLDHPFAFTQSVIVDIKPSSSETNVPQNHASSTIVNSNHFDMTKTQNIREINILIV